MAHASDEPTAEENDRPAYRFSVGRASGYLIYDDWHDCEVLDACSGGAVVVSAQSLSPDDELRLAVEFDGRSAWIDVRAAYSAGGKSVLTFDRSDRAAVEEFLTLVDDVCVYRARVALKEHLARHGVLKFPERAAVR